MIKLRIDSEVHKVDLSPWARYAPTPFFLGEAGVEPYKLLAYLSDQLPEKWTVADLGTLQGASAVALSNPWRTPSRRVLTYDIENKVPPAWPRIPTIEYLTMSAMSDEAIEMYKLAVIVHLDIDPHDGVQEAMVGDKLIKRGFKGLLICDDIHLNEGMEQFWSVWSKEELPRGKKLDATKYGHHSGTGIVVFDQTIVDVEME